MGKKFVFVAESYLYLGNRPEFAGLPMNYYYVNREADPDGFHQVHKRGCVRIPSKLKFIGEFRSSETAMDEAGRYYFKIRGCSACTLNSLEYITR